jgi:bile acid:Na+ symporter, BASS family
MEQMAELVLIPVCLGLSMRYFVGTKRLQSVEPVLPMISAILLYCVDLGLVSSAASTIAKNLVWVPIIGVTTTALCLINLVIAYFLARILRLDRAAARAIMFDVGVYNSGLGAVLASVNFGAFAALPALMNSIMNMTVGSMLAAYLHGHPIPRSELPELPHMTPTRPETLSDAATEG